MNFTFTRIKLGRYEHYPDLDYSGNSDWGDMLLRVGRTDFPEISRERERCWWCRWFWPEFLEWKRRESRPRGADRNFTTCRFVIGEGYIKRPFFFVDLREMKFSLNADIHRCLVKVSLKRPMQRKNNRLATDISFKFLFHFVQENISFDKL